MILNSHILNLTYSLLDLYSKHMCTHNFTCILRRYNTEALATVVPVRSRPQQLTER